MEFQNEFTLNKTDFIFTKDNLSFKKILDTFDDASFIVVVTYSIGTTEDLLYKSLINATKKGIPVKLITNIPGRFESYYSDFGREKSRKKINKYMELLSPKKFNYLLMTYFNFSNHSKIIFTDKLAYVGSSNFSLSSKENYEAGFISDDKSFISFLKNEVLPDLEFSSLNFDNSILSQALLNQLNNLFVIDDYFSCILSDISKTSIFVTGKDYYTGKEFNDCQDSDQNKRWQRVLGVIDALEFFDDHLDDLKDPCFCYYEDIQDFIRLYDQNIFYIEKEIKEVIVSLEKPINFDQREYSMKLFEDYIFDVQEIEETDKYIEIFQDWSFEEKNMKLDMRREELLKLMDLLSTYINLINLGIIEINKYISRFYSQAIFEIDNT